MAERSASDSDRRTVRSVLRGGLFVGTVLMAIGIALALIEGRSRAHPVGLPDIAHLIVGGHPSGIAALGIAVLVATPAVRVLTLVLSFTREHDVRFALVAATVAIFLAIGVALGRA